MAIWDAVGAVERLWVLLCGPLFLVGRRVEIASTNTRLEEARAQVQSLYARWEALEERRLVHVESKEARKG